MTRISVVIPAYNSDRFIGEAIASVFAQTHPALEIIVVDDGSTDGTASVVQRISGPVPISYLKQPNQGPAAARNFGVSVARGDWIAFLDSDDVWYPYKLSEQLAAIETSPTISFCYSSMDFMDAAGRPLPVPGAAGRPTPLFQGHPAAVPSTVLLRKDIFIDSGGFNASLRCAEDWELFSRIVTTSYTHFIPRSLVKYRRHFAQSTKNKRLWAEGWPMYHQLAWDMWHDNPEKQGELARLSAAIYTDVGKHYLRQGQYDEARKFFHMSFDLHPCCWANLRRWGLSHLPCVRDVYRYLNRTR
jgi:glycosyltransferase involved in cell wall biosynthesis